MFPWKKFSYAVPVAIVSLSVAAAVAAAADQPQWGRAWSRNMVSGEKGLPDSFDPKTGRNIRWAADLGTETHATPVVANGRVFIGTNNNRPQDARHEGDRGVLMCLDEQTGRLHWQLIVPKIKTSVYWDWPGAGICSTPTVEGDRVYLVSNRGEVMCLDVHGMANGNRTVSPSNIKSLPVFHANRVHVTVGGDLWWGKHEVALRCIDATQRGDVTRTAEVWSQPLRQHSMSSPAIAEGLVFVGDSGKRIHCMDAATGRPYWTHDVKGEVWSSPLVADGKVYCATRRGEFLVFAADREKKLLSAIDLGSPVSACPVAANGVLYVTTMRTLYAVGTGRPVAIP